MVISEEWCGTRHQFATLRMSGRPGRDFCQRALWDCVVGRIFNMAANSNEGVNAQEEMKLHE